MKKETMMHRDYKSERQEVSAGLIDNALLSFSHLRQHFKPKDRITKCVPGIASYHVKIKMHMNWTERIYSITYLSFMGNGRHTYRKMNSSGSLEHGQEDSKPSSTTARIGFYLLARIPTTFLGPRMLTPTSPSQSNPLVSGQTRSKDFYVRLLAPLRTPGCTWVCFSTVSVRTWLGHLTTAGEDIPKCRAYSCASLWKAKWVIKESIHSKLTQFSQLIWDLPTFSQCTYTVSLFQIVLNQASRMIFLSS